MSFKIRRNLFCAILIFPQILFAQISLGPSRDITRYVVNPIGTKATDIDGDSDLDLVAFEEYGWRIVVWENDGAGNFSNGREWNPPLDDPDNWWQAVGLGDGDGDGVIDVFYLKRRHDAPIDRLISLHVASGDGEGSFDPPIELLGDFLDDDDPIENAIRDFDGNGTLDLVLEKAIYLSDSNGRFSERIDLDFVIEREDLLTDWDNDGDLDLLREEYDRDLERLLFKIFTNQGGGIFEEESLIQMPKRLRSFFRLKDHSGSYQSGLLVRPRDEGELLEVHAVTAEGAVERVASLDVDDLPGFGEKVGFSLFAGPDNRVFLRTQIGYPGLKETGTNFFEAVWNDDEIEIKAVSSGHAPYLIVGELLFSDLDQDGVDDLIATVPGNDRVTGQVAAHLFWQSAKEEGVFEDEKNLITNPAWGLQVSFAEDIDGDGLIDLVGYQADDDRSAEPDLTIWKRKDQEGDFESERIESPNSSYEVFDIVDVTPETLGLTLPWPLPEGRMDFFVTESRLIRQNVVTSVHLLLQDDAGEFETYQLFFDERHIEQIFRVDWDGDGLKDLVYVVDGEFWPNHDLVLWRKCLKGLASFEGGARHLLSLDGAELIGPPKDFDQDGDLDLPLSLTWISTPGESVWAAGGADHEIESLQFASESQVVKFRATDINGRSQELDLDGDGDLDLVRSKVSFRRYDLKRLEWFEKKNDEVYAPALIDGERVFDGNSIGNLRYSARSTFAMGDIDGDGVKDLIVGSAGSASRLEWFKVTVSPQPEAYQEWALKQSLAGHSAAPQADWDGDSHSNWAEFSFGTDPLVVDPGHPGRPHLRVGSRGPALFFRRRIHAEAEELFYRVLTSPDLEAWSPWNVEPSNVTSVDTHYEDVAFPVSGTSDRAFFRVEPFLIGSE